VSYWDSSALVKLYSNESDSALFEQVAAAARSVPVISRLGILEISTTLSRKEAEGGLNAGAAQKILDKLNEDMEAGHVRVVDAGAMFPAHATALCKDIRRLRHCPWANRKWSLPTNGCERQRFFSD
jgi:uncharacterized protein with PIN domain